MTDQNTASEPQKDKLVLTTEEKRRIYSGILEGLKQLTLPEFSTIKSSYDIPIGVDIMAAICDCTDRSIQIFSKEKKISKEYRGRYLLIDSIWGLIRHYRIVTARHGSDDSVEELKKEGHRIDNEIKKIELQKMQGTLLQKEDVKRKTFEKFRHIRDAFLNVHTQLGAIIRGEAERGNFQEIENILRKEIEKVLEELSLNEHSDN